MAEELEKLVRKRGSVKSKVTIFKKFLDSLETRFPNKIITDPILINELEDRSDRFRNILEAFDIIQGEIEQIADDLDKQAEAREAFDDDFYSLNARAKALCDANLDDTSNSQVVAAQPGAGSVHSARSGTSSAAGFQANIKLPVIQLPKFDGNYENWLEFRDSFDSLIHKNDHIGDIQKFHYLRASLSHGALEIIASLEFSDLNYNVAWDLVCKRYNNNRILIQNHVKALFNLGKVGEESSQALRKIIHNVTKHLRALKTLKEPTENWDTLVIHLISLKLDHTTSREWEEKRASYDKPTLEHLHNFLKDRADLLETLENSKFHNKIMKHKFENKTRSLVSSRAQCSYCKKDHFVQDCPEFLKLAVNDRLTQVKNMKLCINCLRSGHLIKQCRSGSCRHCKGRHNSALHLERVEPSNTEPQDQNSSISCSSRNDLHYGTQVLLSTVLVRVFGQNNKAYDARALLDCGSQSSFITSELASKLGLKLLDISIRVCGLNQTESNVKYKTSLRIQSRYNNFNTNISCLVVPEITGTLPNFAVDINSLDIPNNIQLADPKFNIPGKIDLLLGAEHFWNLMHVGQIKLKNQGAVLQNSKLGWIISGSVSLGSISSVRCNLSTNSDIDKLLTRFWEVEQVFTSKPLSQEEKFCEAHFTENLQRHANGKFIVTIPLKENPEVLGKSYESAKKRFLSLERKFKKNPNFKAEYCKFINEYIALGHMSKISENDSTQIAYYLPHHGVVKESSLTTKLRVVFDASSPTDSGYSLNDIQMVGPTIQPDLISTLIRFKKYNFVVAGDIEKMYRMCLINPEQRPLQRILWREHPDNPIEIYELATVTYGTSSASYLAIRCLYQVGLDCSDPEISTIIKDHFYVDDFLSGSDSVEETTAIANNVSQTLKKSGFILRKWVSNSLQVLAGIQTQDSVSMVDFGVYESTKTLGLIWGAQSDSLTYNIASSFSKQVTKRTILSETSQIFDPLGLLSPSIILAKILLQDLWSENLSWDQGLPTSLHTRWLKFRNELCFFNDLEIERQVTCKDYISAELHGFSDASIQAFGAIVYLRTQDSDGRIKVSLVCSKSKVAPAKTQPIPKLELMGALLLTQLMEKVKSSLSIRIDRIILWCDSTTVLGWIKTTPNLLLTFVANRVARIQESTDNADWRHVPTSTNPCDHVSRGVMPGVLCSLEIYWKGPPWLSENESSWPVLPYPAETELPEMRKTVRACVQTADYSEFEKYSDLDRLERVVAYCFRFKENCLKNKEKRYCGPLLCKEVLKASLTLAKLSQLDSFGREIQALLEESDLDNTQIAKLSPFLDENNIMRVGGRIELSNFPYSKKHPILLSAKHYFTKLLFEREHVRLLHAGPQQLLFSIRESFWPISARNLAKHTVFKCVQCFRVKPRFFAPIMGNLPKNRLNPAPPFFTTGVDYAGPFHVKDRKGRGCKITKAYISLFICFVTRAIHLELVSDLTKDSFIAALRRFIARRGKPNMMYSDNGTNFIGANSELRALGEFLQSNAKTLTEVIENKGITWSFIPAHSPHFGGLWEAGVKSTKHHLKRVAGNATLTFEQFSTLLTQIEAVLNSRPISPLSTDPSELSPLTPSHFLIGRAITSAIDPDLTSIPTNRLDYFQQIQQLQQNFWTRWSREYISELQQRQKWLKSTYTLKVDDLVLIKEEHQPPLKWCLGRVLILHPGADGVARVATLKTSSGTLKRSFSKLCPLPINSVL